ncbi:MAG: hypothetical protein HN394_16665 [Rhodospirillaceae bacterium]|jgi:hypothetical protein|nr:hypothetical protein [Rhodospirillaceae bacterium]
MSYNPFPEYRKIRYKEDPEDDEELAKARKTINDQIVQTNPWHTWWEGFFPFLLFIIYIIGGLTLSILIGAEPLSFMAGSIITATAFAVYMGNKKGGDD